MIKNGTNPAARSRAIRSESADLHRAPHAGVGVGPGVRFETVRAHTLTPHIGPERAVPRHEHRDEVRERAARHEHAARVLGEAKPRGRPAEHLPLDLDRHVVAPTQVRVEPGREHLRDDAHRRPRAVHPPHEARVRVPTAVRQDRLHELLGERIERRRRTRGRLVVEGAHRVRDRLPRRPRASIGEVVENVVEQAVRECAERGRVGGLEGRGRVSGVFRARHARCWISEGGGVKRESTEPW
jgi:hypothetical protein